MLNIISQQKIIFPECRKQWMSYVKCWQRIQEHFLKKHFLRNSVVI
uniref:Uncharacterized protein n=1 Tax=Caudovirales sp. ctUJJ3 TaxID=2826777 RepID=A0A8S5NFK1_9CAUD|nr:MAG TPA: hypothetical protein [Caudovirales sp. ctUJJ3]